jgi:hypothetical protein
MHYARRAGEPGMEDGTGVLLLAAWRVLPVPFRSEPGALLLSY